jgi:hypothetical protein
MVHGCCPYGGRCGHDRMVVGFSTTYAISDYHHLGVGSNTVHGEVYSIQLYVIMFISDFRQWVVFPDTPVSFTHKTDNHDIY